MPHLDTRFHAGSVNAQHERDYFKEEETGIYIQCSRCVCGIVILGLCVRKIARNNQRGVSAVYIRRNARCDGTRAVQDSRTR